MLKSEMTRLAGLARRFLRASSPSGASRMSLNPICCNALRIKARMVSWSSTTRTEMVLAWGMGSSPGGGQIEKGLAHGGQGDLFLHRAEFKSRTRHAVDDATRLVLADRLGAGLAHGQKALRAVTAHAGQDSADRLVPDGLGHRVEEHVDRRPVAADGIALDQAA